MRITAFEKTVPQYDSGKGIFTGPNLRMTQVTDFDQKSGVTSKSDILYLIRGETSYRNYPEVCSSKNHGIILRSERFKNGSCIQCVKKWRIRTKHSNRRQS